MKKYYTVITNTFKEIGIDETELPKAMWAFIKDTSVVFTEGACQKIVSITPDRIKTMGWNAGYKPTPEENGEIRKTLGRTLENLFSEVKQLTYESQNLKELETKIWTTQKSLNSSPRSQLLLEKSLQ